MTIEQQRFHHARIIRLKYESLENINRCGRGRRKTVLRLSNEYFATHNITPDDLIFQLAKKLTLKKLDYLITKI